MSLRQQVSGDPLLSKYFRVLGVGDLVPAEYRESNAESYFDDKSGWRNFEKSWRTDEFVLDPTHITLETSATGWSGDTLKKHLMDKCDVQINKTTRNTILAMFAIGLGSSSVARWPISRVAICTPTSDHVADVIDSTSAKDVSQSDRG